MSSRGESMVERASRVGERVRTRWMASPAPVFLRWWCQALLEWVPARWRRLVTGQRRQICLRLEARGLWLGGLAAGGEAFEVPIPPDAALAERLDRDPLHRRRWLWLPAGSALRRRLELPLAAAERLRDVLRFEIDRQTPFSPDQVVFDARVLGRSADGRSLQVEMVALPRGRLDAALADLGPLATGLDGVDLVEDAQPLGLNLLPPAQRRSGRDPIRWLNLGLAGIALLALWLALWQSLENRRQAVQWLTEQVEARRAEARQVASLRQRLETGVEGAGFLARQREERPPALAVLDDLSRRLPDSTALERLNLNGNRLVMIGYSSEAPNTVARLQGSPYLISPALSGPLQPDRISGRDRFTLTADVGRHGGAHGAR